MNRKATEHRHTHRHGDGEVKECVRDITLLQYFITESKTAEIHSGASRSARPELMLHRLSKVHQPVPTNNAVIDENHFTCD